MTKIRVNLRGKKTEVIELNIPFMKIRASDIKEAIGHDKQITGWALLKNGV